MDSFTKHNVQDFIDSLHPPSFFREQVSHSDFEKELDKTMQLYVMTKKSTDANIKYYKGLNELNVINDSLSKVNSAVQQDMIACNNIIMKLDSEINNLKQQAGPDATETASSKQRVSDYSDTYRTKLYICILKVVCVLIFAFSVHFILGLNNYSAFVGTILLYVVILWLIEYVRRKFRRYPNGSKQVTILEKVFDIEETCVGKECCDLTSTEWVQGTGCVKF